MDGLLSTPAENLSQTGDGSQETQTTDTGSWKDSVSREVRFSKDGNDKLARFTDPTSLATSYLEQEKMNSGRVKIPGEDSTPEEVSAFYQKLGKPETAEGYELPELAEGDAYDETMMNAVKQYAFDKNMSNEQLNGMVETYLNEARLAQDRIATQTEDALKQEWGGDYDKNIEISRRALRELAPEEITEPLIAEIANANMDNSQNFVKFLNAIGSKMLDDTLVRGDQVKANDGDYTPAYPSSPEMYANGDDDDSVKGRAWHTARGHIY